MSADNTKRFLPLSPFFKTELTEVLQCGDRFLSIPLAKGMELCNLLGPECYTYLAIGDECDWELLRVEVAQGHLYLSGRGLEDTAKREWPQGTCLEFHFTTAAIWDMVESHHKYGRSPAKQKEQEQDVHKGVTEVLCVGIWDFHVKNGYVVRKTRSGRNLPTSTVTRNTTVCWDENGCITQAGGGDLPFTQLNCGK